MSSGNATVAIGVGILLILIITAPIWLPLLFGGRSKRCECGARMTLTGINPYCICRY